MIKDKSEKLADLYREVGNRYFRKKKFFEALVSYNKVKFIFQHVFIIL